ncbi:uncharacterized protein LOC127261286 [Andrographis paniculata]|uniref:uncharacterized protein LOC127261286 n=1 Tax=Andrographis paniculata TaxID=175694 RepID=UPI0021E766F8|nr:uncharacterized protein LOC127261286 [Andrographis paniculata]
MTMNSQQFGQREVVAIKEASEVSSIQQQLTELTSFVRQFVVGKSQVKACGICASSEHPTAICPTLSPELDVSAAGFIPRAYNHYSNTYNSEWNDQSNLKYRNQQVNFGDHSKGFPAPNHPPQPAQTVPSNFLEDMMKTMPSNMLQFEQETRNSIRNLEEQVSQIANEMCEMKSREKGRLSSRPDGNPRNVSSIVKKKMEKIPKYQRLEFQKTRMRKTLRKNEQPATETSNKVTFNTPTNTKTNVAPFPCRLAKPKKDDKNKESMEMFRKVELNIPLLDAIKQVPKYAKFLNDLCANKKTLCGDECIIAGESVSLVLQRKLPPKCEDPGMFSVPCKIGKLEIKLALLDLGATMMPKSVYKSLNIGPLKETRIIIQLADRANAYPE